MDYSKFSKDYSLSFSKSKFFIVVIMVNNIQNKRNNLNLIAFKRVYHSPIIRQINNEKIACVIFLPVLFWNQFLLCIFSIKGVVGNDVKDPIDSIEKGYIL